MAYMGDDGSMFLAFSVVLNMVKHSGILKKGSRSLRQDELVTRVQKRSIENLITTRMNKKLELDQGKLLVTMTKRLRQGGT